MMKFALNSLSDDGFDEICLCMLNSLKKEDIESSAFDKGIMSEEFYSQLNRSQSMERSYHWFEKYRKALTGDILALLREDGCNDVLVMAAGNMLDVDYPMIVAEACVERLFLTDIDMEGMKRGLVFHDMAEGNVHLEAFDYIGSTGMEHQFDMLSKHLDMRGIKSFFSSAVEGMKDLEYVGRYTGCFDLVILLPVYTQLLFPEW